MELYREDVDAVFWSTAEECAEKCKQLMTDAEWRKVVAQNGRARCIENGTVNERVLQQVLEVCQTSSPSGAGIKCCGSFVKTISG
jgi:hypothetical protein